jgi:hypothetical protein
MALKHVPSLTEVEYWRARAEEARATADTFDHPKAKASMESIARSYDRIADLGERARAEEAAKKKRK